MFFTGYLHIDTLADNNEAKTLLNQLALFMANQHVSN